MQPKKPYFEVSILSRHGRARKVTLVLLIVLGVIAILISVVYALVKCFSPTDLSPRTYYYVYVNTDAQNATDAEAKANEYRVRGGAGLVLERDEGWYVVLSLYLSERDAVSVISQLKAQDIEAQYSSITTTALSTNKLSTEEYEIACNIYSHYKQTIETLYALSIDLDSSTITESSALVRVSQLALLWEQRTETLATRIDLTHPDSAKHPLIDVYTLSMQITGLLDVLADENNYSVNLLTYTSLTRRTTCLLATIDF